jgi:hypothetical protein
MAMAAPEAPPGKVTGARRIWDAIGELPVNPDGSIYFNPGDINRGLGLGATRTQSVLNVAEKAESVEVLRHGKRLVGIRVKGAEPRGSLTERIHAILRAYADERGRVDLNVPTLQTLTGARDHHDVMKGLYDLRRRSVLSMDIRKEGNTDIAKDIRLIKRKVRAVKPAATEGTQPVAEPTDVQPSGLTEEDDHEWPLAEVQSEGQDPGDAEPMTYPVTLTPLTDEWLASASYPGLVALKGRRAHIEAAAVALGEAGPQYAEQAEALLESAETCYTPFEEEVLSLLRWAQGESL